MTIDTLTCPYCNTAIAAPLGLTAGQRIVCPRCGDAFLFRPPSSSEFQVLSSEKASSGFRTPNSELRTQNSELGSERRRSNRLLAGLILGVMFLMAGVGLAFMLMTQDVRRGHDTSRPPRRPGRQRGVAEPDVPPIVAVAPDKLAALGYLPQGVNFLVGARIPELLASPAGVRVLRDPIKVGETEYRLAKLPAWVGLRLEDIDHLVFAAKVDDALLPPFYLVLRTNQRYDDEQLRQRLQGARVASPSKKKLCSFRKGQNGLTLHLWFADEYTLVLALFADQLESLPNEPVEDLRQLPDEVRSVLKTRREPVAPVWIAGHSRDWSKTVAGKFLDQQKKEELAPLSLLRTFGVWIAAEKALDVKGSFRCEDAAAARGLEKYFRSLRGEDPNFKTALDGPWLTVQFRTDADLLSRAMKR